MLPLPGWSFCKAITVQHAYVDEDLTNFSYIVFIDPATQEGADIGAHALATGYDVRFTAADGVTLLTYRRIYFNITAGVCTARFKVKVPTIHTAGGDIIGIHYGKVGASDGATQTGAQDANFKVVIEGDDSLLDVTGNGNNGTKGGTGSVEEAGPIWKAQHFNGIDDFIALLDSNPPYLYSCTFSIHVKPDNAAPVGILDSAPNAGYTLRNYGAGKVEWWPNNPQVSLGLVAGAWASLVFVCRQTTVNVIDYYKGGVLISTNSGGSKTFIVWHDLRLGDINAGGAGRYGGSFAEFSISNNERSAAWIKFTHYNITETDHEATWGAEETAPPAGQPGIYNSILWSGGYPLFKGNNL